MLPKYWVVKRDASHSRWQEIIDYLNTIDSGDSGWVGDCFDYYGYDGSIRDNGTQAHSQLSRFINNPVELTIDEFFKLKNENTMNQITVTLDVDFIKAAHNAACSEWKIKIEKQFPSLFEKSIMVGDRYVGVFSVYLLACTDSAKVCLINIKSGGRWSDAITVKDINNITPDEFKSIIGGDSYVEDFKLIEAAE